MLRPELVYTKRTPQRASLVLLVDDSRSMQVADSLGDAPRWDAVKSLLDASAERPGQAGRNLGRRAPTGSTPRPRRSTIETARSSCRPRRPASKRRSARRSATCSTARPAAACSACCCLSDGAQRAVAPNDLPPQVAVAADGGRKHSALHVHVRQVGRQRTGRPGDRRPRDERNDLRRSADRSPRPALGVRLRQPARRGAAAVGERRPAKWKSSTPCRSTPQNGNQSLPVLLRHTPQTPGEYKVTLRVEPREGELVTTNNEVSTFVTVRAGGINVLYLVGAKRIGGGPGPEQRFVRAALAQSPDIVVERRLLNYEPAEVDLRDVLNEGKIDVIILDDVDARALSLASWQAIAERVRGGAGLMMIGGYHSFGPGGFRETPLADVLPIDIGPAQRQSFDEPLRTDVQLPGPVRMRPAAPLGAKHPIMQLTRTPTADSAAAVEQAAAARRRESHRPPRAQAERRRARRSRRLAPASAPGGRPVGRRPRARVRRRLDLALADARLRRRPSPLLAAGRAVARQERRANRRPRLDQARRPPRDARHARRLHARRRERARRTDRRRPADRRASKRPTAAPSTSARPRAATTGPPSSARPTSRATTASRSRRTTAAQELGTAEARFLVPQSRRRARPPRRRAEPDGPTRRDDRRRRRQSARPGRAARRCSPRSPPNRRSCKKKSSPKSPTGTPGRSSWRSSTLLGAEWYLRKRWGLV